MNVYLQLYRFPFKKWNSRLHWIYTIDSLQELLQRNEQSFEFGKMHARGLGVNRDLASFRCLRRKVRKPVSNSCLIYILRCCTFIYSPIFVLLFFSFVRKLLS